MADITIVNGGYKTTYKTGGHHPVPPMTFGTPPPYFHRIQYCSPRPGWTEDYISSHHLPRGAPHVVEECDCRDPSRPSDAERNQI